VGRINRYPPELRERAVRLVREHRGEYPSEWATIVSIAGKLGIGTEALRLWLRREEIEQGQRAGLSSAERQRLRELERENKELRRANEILKAASAFFARELDPRPPKS
jgi:transposase